MEQLLSESTINLHKLKRSLHKIVATELSSLSEPCYYPSLKKYYYELLDTTKLKEKNIREFVKRFYKGTPASKWKLHRDPISNFYIFLMWVLNRSRQTTAYKSALLLYIIRNYTNLMHKQMKFCNDDTFKYALENLAKTHLFSREKTISGSLFYLSGQMDKRYSKFIKSGDVDGISKFITECRTRISQSIKSFAEVYYNANEQGLSIKNPKEDDDNPNQYQQLEKSSRVINDVIKSLTVYKNIDNKAVADARSLTKVRASLATSISKAVTDIKNVDNIRLILELFVKELSQVGHLCGDQFFKNVRTLMAIKRTKSKVYFKQQINILLLTLVKDIKFTRQYNQLTKQTQSLINLYLAYYLTITVRNSIC
ncbi:MAG: hypothetical protein DRG78_20140 [Epsilonproteobacteria bacterium]|nr:MAG: hypothetical protein DRG78_20140 [Campylobacterota bacterium]